MVRVSIGNKHRINTVRRRGAEQGKEPRECSIPEVQDNAGASVLEDEATGGAMGLWTCTTASMNNKTAVHTRQPPTERDNASRRAGILAEGEGFEPPKACTLVVFKTTAIDHSAIPPA